MGLTIDNASIGYDSGHLTATLNHIHNNCVVKAQNKLRGNLGTLRDSVHDCWQGKSAEAFLNNMQEDVNKLCTLLGQQYQALEGQFKSTLAQMKELDENLVQNRG